MELKSQLFATVLGKLNLLTLAMMTRKPIRILGVTSLLGVVVGTVSRIELEDGSGYKYNIDVLTPTFGLKTVFVDLIKVSVMLDD